MLELQCGVRGPWERHLSWVPVLAWLLCLLYLLYLPRTEASSDGGGLFRAGQEIRMARTGWIADNGRVGAPTMMMIRGVVEGEMVMSEGRGVLLRARREVRVAEAGLVGARARRYRLL